MTVKQAALLLEVSAQTVYALCAAGRLRHHRVGLGRGTIRLTEEALEEYRRGSTVQAVAAPPPLVRRKKLRHLS